MKNLIPIFLILFMVVACFPTKSNYNVNRLVLKYVESLIDVKIVYGKVRFNKKYGWEIYSECHIKNNSPYTVVVFVRVTHYDNIGTILGKPDSLFASIKLKPGESYNDKRFVDAHLIRHMKAYKYRYYCVESGCLWNECYYKDYQTLVSIVMEDLLKKYGDLESVIKFLNSKVGETK